MNKTFYSFEMPKGSGIVWGSEDVKVASDMLPGIVLWRMVSEKPKETEKK